MTTYELGFGKKGHMQQKVQQPHRRLSHPIDPQQPADLRQWPSPTALPVVRIEGITRSPWYALAWIWPYVNAQLWGSNPTARHDRALWPGEW
jgi:hypothetical protein